MVDGAYPTVAELQPLWNAVWFAISTATVDGADRNKCWNAWTTHCRRHYGSSGNAQATENITDRLLTFAVAMREGQYGLSATVQAQSVERALRHVAQRIILDGHPDPRKASPTQQHLDLPIAQLLKNYCDEDPPPQPKLALPPEDRASACSCRPGHYCLLLPSAGGGIHIAGMQQETTHDPPLEM